MISEHLFNRASNAIKEIHLSDPNKIVHKGSNTTAEQLYSERMLKILLEFVPGSDYQLKLAAQCQHLERWKIARDLYTMDRKGYHQWRRAVMDFQLGRTRDTLASVGLDKQDVIEITEILRNQGNKTHEKAQIIQDVACIVFVNWYLQGFAIKHESTKVQDILVKTTRKMSDRGRTFLEQELNILKMNEN